jgi:hypothetical protein
MAGMRTVSTMGAMGEAAMIGFSLFIRVCQPESESR